MNTDGFRWFQLVYSLPVYPKGFPETPHTHTHAQAQAQAHDLPRTRTRTSTQARMQARTDTTPLPGETTLRDSGGFATGDRCGPEPFPIRTKGSREVVILIGLQLPVEVSPFHIALNQYSLLLFAGKTWKVKPHAPRTPSQVSRALLGNKRSCAPSNRTRWLGVWLLLSSF